MGAGPKVGGHTDLRKQSSGKRVSGFSGGFRIVCSFKMQEEHLTLSGKIWMENVLKQIPTWWKFHFFTSSVQVSKPEAETMSGDCYISDLGGDEKYFWQQN